MRVHGVEEGFVALARHKLLQEVRLGRAALSAELGDRLAGVLMHADGGGLGHRDSDSDYSSVYHWRIAAHRRASRRSGWRSGSRRSHVASSGPDMGRPTK